MDVVDFLPSIFLVKIPHLGYLMMKNVYSTNGNLKNVSLTTIVGGRTFKDKDTLILKAEKRDQSSERQLSISNEYMYIL